MNTGPQTLIYKITTVEAWSAALKQQGFAGSPDDVRDGYVHLSAYDQVGATAAKYFNGMHDLLVVAFDPSALGEALRFEPSRGGALFPHYYGTLPTSLALWVRPLPLDPTGIPCVSDVLKA